MNSHSERPSPSRRCGSRCTIAIRSLALGTLAALTGACSQNQGGDGSPLPAPPSYETVARRHNENVADLDQLWAATSVVVRYIDSEGENRSEQGEGNLMIMQPDRVALRVGKLSETLFWIGCDAKQYWFFDLASKPTSVVFGLHDGPGRARSGLTAALPTRSLPDLLGIAPLPLDRPGTTQWSSDGLLIGAVYSLDESDGGGFERVWFDKNSYLPVKVELYDRARKVTVVSDLSEPGFVQLSGRGDVPPQVNTDARIGLEEAGLLISISMGRLEDGRERGNERAKLSPRSFQLPELVSALGPSETIDIDALKPRTPPGNPAPGTPNPSGPTKGTAK